MEFERTFSGAPWEKTVGYCRALRAALVFVTGTAPVGEDGATVAPGDGYAQARRCFEIIEAALGRLGATLADVVRTRLYVTDISRWEEYGRAHAEVFAAHPPCTTMVEARGRAGITSRIRGPALRLCRRGQRLHPAQPSRAPGPTQGGRPAEPGTTGRAPRPSRFWELIPARPLRSLIAPDMLIEVEADAVVAP